MKKDIKYLLGIYLILILIKTLLAYFVPAPSTFADGYYYIKMAQSFFLSGEFTVHGLATAHYYPLYPIILAGTYLLKDMQTIYMGMKIVNVFISSAIIFPAYFLAKEFLSEKKALTITALIAVLPLTINTSNYIMAENLFYPLVMLYVFVLYKAFQQNKTSYFVLAGLILAATFMTKLTGIALVPVCAIVYACKYKKIHWKNILYHYGLALILVLPWLIRTHLIFGNPLGSYSQGLGNLAKTPTPSYYGIWAIFYIGYILLATGKTRSYN